jgi:hypothetical protein
MPLTTVLAGPRRWDGIVGTISIATSIKQLSKKLQTKLLNWA